MQATGDKGMVASLRKTVRTAGARGLFDGITGTWLRQMSYSVCRFWAYDESKKLIGASEYRARGCVCTCVRVCAVLTIGWTDRREVAGVAAGACGMHG